MTAVEHAISAALVHFLWQGVLVAFLLWVALIALRNGSAQLRYSVSCGALAILTALPILTVWLVYRGPMAASTPRGRVSDIPESANFAPFAAADWLSSWVATLETWALPVWFAGVLVFAVRLILGTREVGRLRREGNPAEPSVIAMVAGLVQRMKVDRRVRVLLVSNRIESPSLVGWLRPVILLPVATLMNLSVEQLMAVLAHEVAHVRRHDYVVNVVQSLVETLFFYQPVVWWVSSQIRRERELCCDDIAVQTCGDAVVYARALAKLERSRVISPELVIGSTSGPLLYRIQRLAGVVKPQPPSKLPAIVSLGVALLCLMTNLDWAYAQPQTTREAAVHRDTIWLERVKYGDMPILVRARGAVTTASTAELKVAASQATLVQNGQAATVHLPRGITIAGKVSRVDFVYGSGTATVVVELEAPEFTGEPVDGIILIRTLRDVIYVSRPAAAPTSGESALFRVEPDGSHATRVNVRFGAQSVNTVQILDGLQPGDRVILSDTSKYNSFERIRLE